MTGLNETISSFFNEPFSNAALTYFSSSYRRFVDNIVYAFLFFSGI